MAAKDDDEPVGSDERIRRQVGRTIANWIAVGVSLAVIGGWLATGYYEIAPGESGVVLRLGKYNRTITNPGPGFHFPPPLEYIEKVNVSEIRREKFGFQETDEVQPGTETATFETAIQTTDQNIVNLSYVVQYRIEDPFSFIYGMASPDETLRDAAQSAVREVVGSKSIDSVLSAERGVIQKEAEEILQITVQEYFTQTGVSGESTPFKIDRVSLQIVQPPAPVQEAFDDVIAAQQDEARASSKAQGDSQEIIQQAEAKAIEIVQSANAFKDAKILEASGEAQRFIALHTEYALAPEVTRRRLYLETMEQIMPGVEKVIVEPGSSNLVPLLSLTPAIAKSAAGREEGK